MKVENLFFFSFLSFSFFFFLFHFHLFLYFLIGEIVFKIGFNYQPNHPFYLKVIRPRHDRQLNYFVGFLNDTNSFEKSTFIPQNNIRHLLNNCSRESQTNSQTNNSQNNSQTNSQKSINIQNKNSQDLEQDIEILDDESFSQSLRTLVKEQTQPKEPKSIIYFISFYFTLNFFIYFILNFFFFLS